MTSEPTDAAADKAPASDIYEIVLDDTGSPKKWFRMAMLFVVGLFTMGAGPTNPGGAILSVRRIDTGEELFRHIEDLGDDEGHLLHGLQQDLASMTAAEFKARWLDS